MQEGKPWGAFAMPEGATLDQIEMWAILWTLEKTNQNRLQTANRLGVSVRTIRNKLKKYRLSGDS